MKKKGLGKLRINIKAAEELSEFGRDHDPDEYKIIDNGNQDEKPVVNKKSACSFKIPIHISDTLRDEIRAKN